MQPASVWRVQPSLSPVASRASAPRVNEHRAPIYDLLTSGFVRRHSRFDNLDALLAASGLDPRSLADLSAERRWHWDQFVRHATTFPDWAALLREAGAEWTVRRIGIFTDI
jgi:hypothetical protein